MYKLIQTSLDSKINSVRRTNPDGSLTFIPLIETNSDYQGYLKWISEGNTPEPADVPEGE